MFSFQYLLRRLVVALSLGMAADAALAQRVIRIVVPFASGAVQDTMARTFSSELGLALGATVIVENRAGAGGAVGSALVAQSKPDGNTLLLAAASHHLAGRLYNKLPYHPIKDFVGVSFLGASGFVIAAPGNLNVVNLADYLKLIRSKPGELNYASAGTGSATHIGMAYFLAKAGLDMQHIPVKSTGEAVNEVLAGRTQGVITSVIGISGLRGDVNGDGLSDLIVGASAANASAGSNYVVFGKSSGGEVLLTAVKNGQGGFVINGASAGEASGTSVSAAGDVNGDGLADLIVGAPAGNGRSYVIFGKTTGSFQQTAVDWQGTDGADTQSDGGTAKTLVAGAGDDVLTATAASVLYGGAGKDTFNIDQAMITALQSPMGSGGNTGQLARIDGGSGLDTLALSGSGLTLDLTQVANQAASNPDGGSRIDSVEVIDLTGSGNNALKLKASDVLDMGSANLFQTTGRQQLLVKGNAGDTVDLADAAGTTGWTQASANATIDSASYQVWNHSSLATVYVQTGVLVA